MQLLLRALLTALLFFGSPAIGDPAPTFVELYRKPIADSEALEVVVGIIERSGASTTSKHYHPRGEYGVVLNGSITIVSDGSVSTTLEIGDTFYQSPGEWHIVSTGSSPSKTVVFRVVEKGKPMVVQMP